MTTGFVAQLRDVLISGNLARPTDIRPLALSTVEEMEEEAGAQFPHSYRAFLLAMGGGAGHFWKECRAYYPDVVRLTPELRSFLARAELPSLPLSTHVFYDRYGDNYSWFSLDDPDPAVWWFDLSDDGYVQLSQTFSEFALADARGLAELLTRDYWERRWAGL